MTETIRGIIMSNHSCWVGIDNGVSGSIGIISPEHTMFLPTPTFSEQSYTKKKQNITRINVNKLREILVQYLDFRTILLLERPMVNPGRWKATISAIRALEATLGVIEFLGMAYQYIDSKEWQSIMLPKGVKGSPVLKKASSDIGKRLFPQFSEQIRRQKDADGILIAEWARRSDL